MEFRGFLSVVAYCESKSIIEILKATNLPVLDALAEIFRREATTALVGRMRPCVRKERDKNVVCISADHIVL